MLRLFSKKSNATVLPEGLEKLTITRINQLKTHCLLYQIPIKNFQLLDLAVTHTSYEAIGTPISYERLEFLGDSVLGLCLAHLLYNDGTLSEGKMSALKANLVDEKTLASLGEQLKLDKIVKLGRGERLKDKRAREKVLCDLFESVLAVIYLDHGLQTCQDFINRFFESKIKEALTFGIGDYKTLLQKITVKIFKEYPSYEIIKTEGPDHGKIFVVQGKIIDYSAEARGRSKKEAEQGAAKQILEQIREFSVQNPDDPLSIEYYNNNNS